MPRYILKIKGRKKESYMVYSTIVDAPIYYNMAEKDVRKWWLEQFGKEGLSSLERRMELVEKTGSSIGRPVQEIVRCNRAGKGGKKLSYDEIVSVYVDLTSHDQ